MHCFCRTFMGYIRGGEESERGVIKGIVTVPFLLIMYVLN